MTHSSPLVIIECGHALILKGEGIKVALLPKIQIVLQGSKAVQFFGEKQHIKGTVEHLRFRNTGFFRHLPYFLLGLLVNGCLHTLGKGVVLLHLP